jgi:hypothetical protein
MGHLSKLATSSAFNLRRKETLGEKRMFGCGPKGNRIVDTAGSAIDSNGFLQTVDLAYNFHQTLRLRPDDIWLLISMGFSTHVNADPEKYRELLVQFEGQKVLEVYCDLHPGAENDWESAGVFDEFSAKIREHIGSALHDTLVADFTTTTPLDRAVSQIVLMDSCKAFFRFEVHGFCGIPFVVLEGTESDWQNLRNRIEAFTQFDLNWWIEDLRYVLDQFVAAKQGKVDVGFWKRMFRGYHVDDGYAEEGFTLVSGWVHVFFPYLRDGRRNRARMPAMAARRQEGALYKEEPGKLCAECGSTGEGAEAQGQWWCKQCWRAHDLKRWYRHELAHEDFPSGIRKVPFEWYPRPGLHISCDFIAGFAGCAKGECLHEVRPQLAYCVMEQ